MSRIPLSLFGLLILLLLVSSTPATLAQQQPPYELKAPRIDFLLDRIYLNTLAESFALRAGEVDLMDSPVSPDLAPEFIKDKGLVASPFDEQGMWQVDLNLRKWPLGAPDGTPEDQQKALLFRRALAQLSNKERMISEFLKGFGVAIDTPVPEVTGWRNPNVRKYPYNPAEAARLLDQAGFTKGADGWRIDPKTGQTLRKLVYAMRTDRDPMRAMGEVLLSDMTAAGIPIDPIRAVRAILRVRVFQNYDFDMYTGGWGLGFIPDHLYDIYNSGSDIFPEPFGLNYGGVRSLEFDRTALGIKTETTLEGVTQAIYKSQEIFMDNVYHIPMIAQRAVIFASSKWDGWINHAGGGFSPCCGWNYGHLSAHPKGQAYGGTLRWGFTSDVTTLNVVTAQFVYEANVIGSIYEGLLVRDPYTPSKFNPNLAKSWKIEGVDKTPVAGKKGVKVTFELQDTTWHDGRPFTADDVVFTYEYFSKTVGPGFVSTGTLPEFYDSSKAVGPKTVEIYLNDLGYFGLDISLGYYIIPKHIWDKVGKNFATYDPVKEKTLIGTGPFLFVDYKPGEFIHLKANKNWHHKRPEKDITFETLSVPTSASPGATPSVSVKAIDYTGTPITKDATVKVNVAGKDVPLTHVGGGVWSASLPPLASGTQALKFDVTWKAPTGFDYGKSLSGQISVGAAAAPVGVVTPAPAAPAAFQPAGQESGFGLATGILVLVIIMLAVGFVISRLRVAAAPSGPAASETKQT